jgi:hypothetical protein
MKQILRTIWPLLSAIALSTPTLRAATYVVNNTTDSGPGSLRQAILNANAGGGGTIDLTGVGGIITLGTNLPSITASVNLLGPGTNVLTISGSNAFVIFTMEEGATNSLSDLTIADGYSSFIPEQPNTMYAPGVRNFGSLTLQNCVVQHCLVYGTDGGGIFNAGSLEMDNCRITNCGSADDGAEVAGGGIYNLASMTLNGCTIGGYCVAQRGGGIYTSGIASLTRCLITGCGTENQGDGAGLVNVGKLTLVACVVTNNHASYTTGGIGSGGEFATLIMTNTLIVNNYAAFESGGGLNVVGSVSCFNCTISGNGSGAIAQFYGGGGIYSSATLTLVNCTISGNSALPSWVAGNGGAGIENLNVLIMTNCTVSGNTIPVESGSPYGFGGGIFNGSNAVAYLTACTIVSNSAPTGAGFYNTNGTVYATDTIIANNGIDFLGALTSQGYNLIGNTNGCTLLGDPTGNLYDLDSLLGPLQNNGGPTLTHALLAGSPAIDAGPTNSPPYFDQRGAPRPFGAADDIGAFEYGSVSALNLFLAGAPSPAGLQLNLTGTPSFTYLIQRASIPSGPWSPLTLITTDPTTGSANFLDPNPPPNQAFYRLVFP